MIFRLPSSIQPEGTMRWILLSFFAFLGFEVGSLRAKSPSPLPKVQTNIVYGKAGEKELKLDMAKPEGKGPFPVVVCVHGGAWRMGNKRDLQDLLPYLAKRGYVGVSIGYRLAPDAVFPAQIEDCKTAVRYLRANAEKYGIDKERIGAMGFSAGGHLVALMGLADASAGFEGTLYPNESSKVQCVVDYFGPTDFADYAKDESAQRSTFIPLMGAKYEERPELHDKASPVNYVNKAAPPFLIFHGTKDWLVSHEQSRKLNDKLKKAGASVEYVEIPNESHGWGGEVGKATTKKMMDFFDANLKKRAQ
jgi:acetyl esterase/lipase